MNKSKLLEYIDRYHTEKGLGRKHLPFYPAVSEGMHDLILFVEKLPSYSNLSDTEYQDLVQILDRELFTHKEDWLSCRLTVLIFKDIYDKLPIQYIRKYPIPKNNSIQSASYYDMERVSSFMYEVTDYFFPSPVPESTAALAKQNFVSTVDGDAESIYYPPTSLSDKSEDGMMVGDESEEEDDQFAMVPHK